MKNKLIHKLMYAISVVILFTADFAYSAPSAKAAIKTLMTKYSLAMFGVVVFSVLIYIGLTVYNKFFVASQVKDFKLSKDSLRTPSDKDEAVMMFITKNRLK